MSFRNVQSLLRLGLTMLFSALAPAGLFAMDPTPVSTAKAPGLENVSSVEMVRSMGLGWNLGNTMECAGAWIKGPSVRSFETAWGNPETTKDMIDKIKASGFNSIRIPRGLVQPRIGDDYTIDPGSCWRASRRSLITSSPTG